MTHKAVTIVLMITLLLGNNYLQLKTQKIEYWAIIFVNTSISKQWYWINSNIIIRSICYFQVNLSKKMSIVPSFLEYLINIENAYCPNNRSISLATWFLHFWSYSNAVFFICASTHNSTISSVVFGISIYFWRPYLKEIYENSFSNNPL